MQIIAGQNVSPNSMPGPTGFGFGSGHNPNAAAVMMNNSGVAPTTSKTRPTLTHVDLRYWLMADCGLTVKLRGRTTTPDERRGRTLSFGARGDTTECHGPLQRWLGGTPSPVPHRALSGRRLVNTVNSRRNSCAFWNVFATEVSTVKLYALRLTSTLVPEILRRAAVEQLAVLLDI